MKTLIECLQDDPYNDHAWKVLRDLVAHAHILVVQLEAHAPEICADDRKMLGRLVAQAQGPSFS